MLLAGFNAGIPKSVYVVLLASYSLLVITSEVVADIFCY